ncbi:MAG TPA: hypothetical protein PL163_06995 [Leptospiraceae bacterium]|nr:hypothetical protein [Leptospiraceae bacterium]
MRISSVLKFSVCTGAFFISIGIRSEPEEALAHPKQVYSFPVLDYPFNTQRGSIRTENNSPVPSMEQSLHITKNAIQISHRGLLHLFEKFDRTREDPRLQRIGLIVFDYLFYALPVPTNISWMHEEWHRAVLGRRNIGSQDDVYIAKPFASSISVSHVKDEDLVRLKKDHPAEMVRLSAAGMESQTVLNLQLKKDSFVFGTDPSFDISSLWINSVSNTAYLQTCSGRSADHFTVKANLTEKNISKRDFVGLDCNAWVYDLFRPNEPYSMRGTHWSGNGIDRYIKYSNETNLSTRIQNFLMYGNDKRHSDLTKQEQDYLNLQYRLSYVNFLNPSLLGYGRFSSVNPFNGRDFYWSAGAAHYLTPFGYSLNLHMFFKQDNINIVFIYHTYINAYRKLPGAEIELIRYPGTLLGKKVFWNLGIHLWIQPNQQKFWTAETEAGALAKVSVSVPVSENLEIFLGASLKSRGWVAGNVYLDKAAEIRTGFSLYF